MIKRITDETWNAEWLDKAITDHRPYELCGTPFSVAEIESKYNLTFKKYQEDDQFDDLFSEMIEIDNKLYWLRGIESRESKMLCVWVVIKRTQHSPEEYLNSFCAALNIKVDDLLWTYERPEKGD